MGDNMKLGSGFVQFLISKALKKALIKKIGNPDLEFSFLFNSPFVYASNEDYVKIHLDATIDMRREDFEKLIKDML